AKSARCDGPLGVSCPRPFQTKTTSSMCARLVALATLPSTCTVDGNGLRSPGVQVAETTAALKPAPRDTSTSERVSCALGWASASSTVPTRNPCRRSGAVGLVGGSGGAAAGPPPRDESTTATTTPTSAAAATTAASTAFLTESEA